jgi:hypothetical protein
MLFGKSDCRVRSFGCRTGQVSRQKGSPDLSYFDLFSDEGIYEVIFRYKKNKLRRI